MSSQAPHDEAGAKWVTAYVGLGANLGDAQQALRQAAQELAGADGIGELTLSPLYRTAPIESSGPDYINAVASLHTRLPPHELLDVLQHIERLHGRERPYRNAPRTLDLDLLLYDEQCIDTQRLTVPHPRMHLRAFVLRPLLDLAPEMKLQGKSLPELLEACADQALQAL